jgi:hypothetical protein
MIHLLAACFYVSIPQPHPTHFDPEDGSGMFFQNISIHPKEHPVSQQLKPQSE